MSTARNADGSMRVVTVPAETVRAPLVGAWAALDFDAVEVSLVSGMVTVCQAEGEEIAEVVMSVAQARLLIAGLADLLGPDPAALPPLLPPLTAVQRAWVVAMAKAVVETDRSPQFGREERLAWSMHRWGFWTARRLDALVQAVAVWRVEQEVARDA